MNDFALDRTIEETQSPTNPNGQENLIGDNSPTRLHWAVPDRQMPQFLQPTRWWITSTAIPLLAVRGKNSFSASVFPPMLSIRLWMLFIM